MKKIIFLLILVTTSVIPVKAYETSATSSILMDIDSSRIIYANNIHKVRSVASISKIMTAIIAIESNKLDEIVTIEDNINKAYGSGIYIKPSEEMSLRDLVYGLMLRSGNDASLAIAKYVGGSEENFVTMMNKKAKEIGMNKTVFNNPNGLDQEKGNYSTAYDMALLMSYAMKNKDFRIITKTKRHKVKTNLNYYDWTNKNKLLSLYKYTTGGKTGYTTTAKRTLVTSAKKNNLHLTAVTLNDGNDFLDHKNLYEEAFKEYKSYKILSKGNINIINEKYYQNENLYIKENFYYPLLDIEKNSIILKFKLDKNTNYKDNSKVGEVHIFLGDKEIHKTNIYLKIKKNKKNFWSFK